MPEAAADQPCQECHGSGWSITESADGSAAQRCRCFKAREKKRALERAGIPPRYEHCELDEGFDEMNPSLGRALRLARQFVDQFPLGDGLLFCGPCGIGKTHLAVALTRALVLGKGVKARFVDFRELLKAIQASYNPLTETSEKQVLASVLDCELLVIDDLGAEKQSAWVRDTIAFILNDRYKRKRPVVITTNLSDRAPEASEQQAYESVRGRHAGLERERRDLLVDRIGMPARSRLHEMCKVVAMTGEDYRQKFKALGVEHTYGDD